MINQYIQYKHNANQYKNIPTKFHPDPSLNNGVGFSEEVAPTITKTRISQVGYEY